MTTRAEERTGPHWIEGDSLRVTNAIFSPNDDSVRDRVSFALWFTRASRVLVHVRPVGAPDTVAVVLDSIPRSRPGVTFSFAWDGVGTDSLVQPEGDYTVLVRGLVPPDSTGPVLPDSTLFFFQRQVRIDVTPPTIEIFRVVPHDYAPTTQHVGVVPEIHVRLTQAQLEDSVGVEINDGVIGRIRRSLRLSGGFSGDGDYVALCEDCTLPTFIDGVYVLATVAKDVAGNLSLADSTLDKNIAGPTFSIQRPGSSNPNRDPLGRFHFQLADSLVGSAADRQVVDSMVVTIPMPPDSLRIQVARRDSIASGTFNFNQDLSRLLTAEGTYNLTLTAWDAARVSSEHRISIVVDRTRPSPPLITPPLPPATQEATLQFTVAANDTVTRAVIIQGGVDPPDTLEVRVPRFSWLRRLNPGPNRMSFEAMDYARNISVADTMTVVWETSEGLVAPERFEAGHNIQVDVGASPAQRVSVRILALDGGLVRTFNDAAARLVYTFPWDLTTPEGRPVKNGGYLLWVQVRYPDGREKLFRKMIAVVR